MSNGENLLRAHASDKRWRYDFRAYRVIDPMIFEEEYNKPSLPEREFRVDWPRDVLAVYVTIPVGMGAVFNVLADYKRANAIVQLERYGLTYGTDYTMVSAKRDADGSPLPTGHWTQYIRRLSPRVPSGL